MRYVVTGGSGFIGSAVCLKLVQELGHELINVDALTYAASPLSLREIECRENYRFVQRNICDQAFLTALIAETQPDAVLHLAAESHVDRSIDSPGAFIKTNVMGTQALLDATLPYWDKLPPGRRANFRFLHVSTDEVFGSLGPDGFFTEASPYDPRSPYSASKAASDHLVRAWGETYGLPVLISNCSNNYGPRQFPEKLIPLTILNALAGKPIPVYGDGLNTRDWIHVEDHARALVTILERGEPGETYLVGARSEQTNLQVVESICEILNKLRPAAAPYSTLIHFVTDRPGHDRRYAIDPTKLERQTGWRPRENFKSGLASTITWYLDNREWWQPLRSNVYKGGRLGARRVQGTPVQEHVL